MNLSRTIGSLVLSTSVLMSAGVSHAACSREDVEFYLGKGFTPEQITSLCASPTEKAEPAKTSAEDKTTGDTSATQSEEPASSAAATTQSTTDDNERFLQQAIKAKDVLLDPESLNYTVKICVEYGDRDLFGFAPKACPDVRFRIERKGLEVTKTGKKYFFYGTAQVKVRSGIGREIVGGLEQKDLEFEQTILEMIETGNETGIPIRDDFPLDEAEDSIRRLAL